MPTKDRLPKYRLSRLTPYAIAEKFGVHYDGDLNPIDHGGVWFKLVGDDVENGYVEAVRIEPAEGDGRVEDVEQLTILLPNDFNALFHALHCAGYDINDPDYDQLVVDGVPARMLAVTRALLWYGSYEIEHSSVVYVNDGDVAWYAKLDDPKKAQTLTENQILNLAMHYLGVR